MQRLDLLDGNFQSPCQLVDDDLLSKAVTEALAMQPRAGGECFKPSPLVVLNRILCLYGEVASKHVPEKYLPSIRSSSLVPPLGSQAAAVVEACVERVWVWLQSRGRSELRKARSLAGLERTMASMCTVREVNFEAPPLEALEGELRTLSRHPAVFAEMQFLDSFRRGEAAKEVKEAKVTLDSASATLLSARLSKSLSGAAALVARRQDVKVVVSFGPSGVHIIATPLRGQLAPGGPLAVAAGWAVGAANWIQAQQLRLDRAVRSVVALFTPLATATVILPREHIGRFLGRQGAKVNSLRQSLFRQVECALGLPPTGWAGAAMPSSSLRLALGVLNKGGRPTVGGGRQVTVTVWMLPTQHSRATSRELTEPPVLQSLKTTLHSSLAAAVAAAAAEAAQARALRAQRATEKPCRLARLKDLTQYCHEADKERAVLRRARDKRSKRRAMQRLGVRQASGGGPDGRQRQPGRRDGRHLSPTRGALSCFVEGPILGERIDLLPRRGPSHPDGPSPSGAVDLGCHAEAAKAADRAARRREHFALKAAAREHRKLACARRKMEVQGQQRSGRGAARGLPGA